jgi:hypothetical protein
MCLMEATDAGAGWLEKDPRKPPSAASKWTGDLRGEHNLFIISIPGDQHFRQLNSKNGSGTSRSTTRAGNVISRAWDSRRRLKVSVSTRNQSTTMRVIHKPGATTAIQFNIMTNTGLQTLMTNGARRFLSRTRSTEPTVRSIQYVKSICTGRYNSLHRDRILTRTRQATAGVYQFAINHDGGLIAKNIESPRHAVLSPMSWGRSANPGELPAIEFASDVFWAYWVRDNPNVKNFRVYGAHNVINTDTTLLVARALKNVGTNKLSVWPGNVFNIGSEEFRVLIGKSCSMHRRLTTENVDWESRGLDLVLSSTPWFC